LLIKYTKNATIILSTSKNKNMTNDFEHISGQEADRSGFEEKFSQRLDALSLELPEVAETRGVIEQGGKAIAQEFGLHSELLDDEAHSLYFIAIAQRNGQLEQRHEAEGDFDTYTTEKQLIYDAMALAALDKSDNYESYKKQICTEEEVAPEVEEEIYEKYTNKEATEEMERAIAAGLLDDVKSRLGVCAENEDPYRIRVLNIWGNHPLRCDMSPSIPPGLEAKPYNDPEWADYNKKVAAYDEYEKALKDSGKEFALSLKSEDDIPMAWKSTINGVKTLLLPLPIMEKLLHRDEKCSERYSDDDLSRDKAILEHEYVHTQGGLLLDEKSLIGVAAEELRAEKFSSNKQGYNDIKEAAIFMLIMTGYNLVQDLETHEKGGKIEDLFKTMANNIGLQRTLELGLTTPSSAGYMNEDISPMRAEVARQLGGLNGFVERLHKDTIESNKGEYVDKRFMQMAESLNKMPKNNIEVYLNYMSGINGMVYGANMLRAKLEKLWAA